MKYTGHSRRCRTREAFWRRLQPEPNLTPFGEINAHLDTADGRFWIQMEWNALQKHCRSKEWPAARR